MSKETPNYKNQVLSPDNDVRVKLEILLKLRDFVDKVRANHTTFKYPQQTTWYNKETHEPIKSGKKISDEKLKEGYYQSINIATTQKKGEVVYDEFSMAAFKLQAEFEDVFRYNVDIGNSVDKDTQSKDAV